MGGGKSIAHCKQLDFTFLPFTFLPFGVEDGPGRGKLTLRLLGESIAHCKSLDFTFLPFTFLPFGGGDGPEEGNSHFGYWEGALHIANPLTLPFYLLPFYLLREDGGPGRGKLTLRLLGGSIAHCK